MLDQAEKVNGNNKVVLMLYFEGRSVCVELSNGGGGGEGPDSMHFCQP